MSSPTSQHESSFRTQYGLYIAGADEVGCGALAGPVIAAAVILSPHTRLSKLNDSKKLTPLLREQLSRQIKQRALAWALGEASLEEIEQLNIRQASLLASRRAIEQLSLQPQAVISDAFLIPGLAMPCIPLVRADARCRCVAAASIVAKVYRDQLMAELDATYPLYAFKQHKGYGTALHLARIREHGPSPIHRRSFLPIRSEKDA